MNTSKWVAYQVFLFVGVLFSFTSCMSAKHIKAQEIQTDLALRQMHSEIEEQKYKLNRLEVELQIAEGKTESQSKVTQEILKEVAKLSQKESHLLETTLQELKEKISSFEQSQSQISQSIRELILQNDSHAHCLKMHKEHLNEADALISEQAQRYKEVQNQLKSLLVACEREEVGQAFYVVQKGDTLVNIAQNQGIPYDTLLKLNAAYSDQLVVGQRIRLK